MWQPILVSRFFIILVANTLIIYANCHLLYADIANRNSVPAMAG